LRVAFAGTPEFALPALHALSASRHELVGVLTRPDQPRGRGRHIEPTPVKRVALEKGLPIAQPSSPKDEAARIELAAWRPDVLVVVAYGMILPQSVLDIPRFGCVNIHASLLPRWRGAAPIERAILAGDSTTGVSIMLMDAGLDTGPVLLRREVGIAPDETAGGLRQRLAASGAEALIEAFDGWPEGALVPQNQRAVGVTHAPKIAKTEARIDWHRDAESLERQVRAFNPAPIAETRVGSEQLRIWRAQALPDEKSRGVPGLVVVSDAAGVTVQSGRGHLRLIELQRPGRRPVAARELAHSLPMVGRVLGNAEPVR
jgi:methionyl-tRNA formyltransferase